MGVYIFFLLTITFYLYGSHSKKSFIDAKIDSIDHKVRVVGSKIKLDRFYSNIDPISYFQIYCPEIGY